jgi:hypothetical protein
MAKEEIVDNQAIGGILLNRFSNSLGMANLSNRRQSVARKGSFLANSIVIVMTTIPVLNVGLGQKLAASDQFYYNINCLSEISLEETCNVSFMKKSMSARFTSGINTKVKYDEIIAWNYTDSTKLKIDLELAARIGLIGLLFKKAVHRHVFSISYRDGFGDKKSLILNFSDSQYVLPVKSALSDYAGSKEVN